VIVEHAKDFCKPLPHRNLNSYATCCAREHRPRGMLQPYCSVLLSACHTSSSVP
jgi:hypothetical protein